MGDVKMRRENIRYEARGKSFEIECPQGFASIEAIVCWCDAGGGWHREAFESFLDARGRLDGLVEAETKKIEAQGEADANAVLANSLNDQVLQQHYIDALKSIGKDGNLVVVPEGSQPIVGTK